MEGADEIRGWFMSMGIYYTILFAFVYVENYDKNMKIKLIIDRSPSMYEHMWFIFPLK